MSENKNKNYFILLGGAEHIDFFRENIFFENQQWFWTVPKKAKKGDIGFVYLCAPISRIVGEIELTAEPFYNTHLFPRWENNWMAEIGNVKYFEPRPELKTKRLKELFPDWGWLRYPRGKTQIPVDIVEPFLELMNTNA
jgi:hypothetical protein